MDKSFFDTIMSIVARKDKVVRKICEDEQSSCSPKWLESTFYLDAIVDEVEEVRPHIKENNSVYLEDELGDILWDYMNLIYTLKKQGKIQQSNVFKNMLEKYEQRISALENGTSWDEVKQSQKKLLESKHNKKYNA